MAVAETSSSVDAWHRVQRRTRAAQAVFSTDGGVPPYGPAVEVALEHLATADDPAARRAALEEAAWARCPEDEVRALLERTA